MKNPMGRARSRRMSLAAVALAVAGVGCLSPVATATVSSTAEPGIVRVADEPTYFAPLIDAGTSWRYLATGVDPSPTGDRHAWAQPGFDDSAWATGKGGFGAKWESGVETANFDDGMRATTVLPMRPTGGDNIPTYFFRTTFDVTAEQLATGEDIRFDGYIDDAAVIFINGEEVKRHLVEDGTPNVAYDSGTGEELAFTIPTSKFRTGSNTIAVRLHQDRATSSDIWFSLDHLGGELPPPPSGPAVGAPSRVILTPSETPETSQSFTWLAGAPDVSVGRVQLRVGDGPIRTVGATSQGTAVNQANPHFSATVRGLKPDTEYTYRVGNPDAWSQWKTFTTADPDAEETEYVYYGDAQIGLDSTWPNVVKLAREKAPNSIGSVHASDLIDTSSNDTQWKNWFTGMGESAATTNIFAAPGNHEYSGDRLLKSWKAHFEYPDNQPNSSTIGDLAQRSVGDTDVARQYQAYFDHWSQFAHETVYYSDYQGIRFITINATTDSTFLTPQNLPSCSGEECPSKRVAALWAEYQAAWMDHILGESPAKWNVVTFHQPVYSASAGRDEPHLRGPWVPVFQKHNIDLVQMGHDHVYARGFNNENRTERDGVTDGPVYIVQNSGAKHYDLETDERNVWTKNGATQVRKGEDFSSFAVVKVTDDRLHYTSYIAEKTASSTTDVPVGGVWDEFVVTKHDDGRKVVTEAGAPVPEFEDLTPAPQIVKQSPTTVRTKVGGAVRLAVEARAEGGLSYQWQRSPVGKNAWTDIVNQDKSTLVMEDVTANTARQQYRVAVTSGTRTVHSLPTTVIVAPDRKIASKVAVGKATVKAGRKAAVAVRPSVTGKVRVTVRVGGKKLTRTVTVKAGRKTTVRLGAVPKRARGRAVITVVLNPSDAKYATSTRTKAVKVKR
ncbi:fibronectin type III domain-containing protein [Aeromicrobium duanguangcaii]|uniref:Fibronectin type III domain-containing protein n=1 Tax=Aeromicrobium duanguangcaii TaxID=2968086 RepID=A0ABY5KKF1_9ACTN|nr:fibronectin type III domain-containing protein [Aeromicrobium duanguangcaii]MCD9153345.1 fibronectin type III domain-containing protein [Aeromicrobium duanguangcaii]UUI69561.1 fibronectin type III domain-containing protein [Aeromicrobium duanguangcaii]